MGNRNFLLDLQVVVKDFGQLWFILTDELAFVFFSLGALVVLVDFAVGFVELLIAVWVNPFMGILLWICLTSLGVDVVAGLPDKAMQKEEGSDKEKHSDVDDQADQEQRVRPPAEDIAGIIVDPNTLDQRKEAAQGGDVYDDLEYCDSTRGRELFLDGGDEGDIAEDHGCDGTDAVGEFVGLEEDGQTQKSQEEERYEDGGQ